MSLFSNNKTEEKEAEVVKKDKASSDITKTAKKVVKSDGMKELYSGDDKKSATTAKKALPVLAGKILVKPLVTEKGSSLSASGKYVFAVVDSANKISVEKAILEVYGIKPVKVNIINILGKVKRHGRVTGKRKDWKKAIVTLPKGKTIEVYDGI